MPSVWIMGKVGLDTKHSRFQNRNGFIAIHPYYSYYKLRFSLTKKTHRTQNIKKNILTIVHIIHSFSVNFLLRLSNFSTITKVVVLMTGFLNNLGLNPLKNPFHPSVL